VDLEQLRREYLQGGLRKRDITKDPLDQFKKWLKQAIDTGLKDCTAMTVATVDTAGQPSQRIVLLKYVNRNGFVFYTNYGSHKARDIMNNPKVSLHFSWHILERQVQISGVAEKISREDSAKYFMSRPGDSQLAAWASRQSRYVSSQQMLMRQFDVMKEKFHKREVPLPIFWGGYLVVPRTIEFWQGGSNRLHDRMQYTREPDGWCVERLAP